MVTSIALVTLSILFALFDMGFVWWYAYQSGGTITVGDRMEILAFEMTVIFPVAFIGTMFLSLTTTILLYNWWKTR